MLINHETEYVLGTLSWWQRKKVTGRRKSYSLLGGFLRAFAGAVPGFICMLLGAFVLDNVTMVIIGGAVGFFGGLMTMITWGSLPTSRYCFVNELKNQGRLITDDDILFQLVMTDDVKYMLELGELHSFDDVKERVDAFIEFLRPYREWFRPEQSEFLTKQWEKTHGKLYERPELIAIGEEACCVEELRDHVRQIVLGLRQKKAAALQRSQVTLIRLKANDGAELEYQQSALLQKQ